MGRAPRPTDGPNAAMMRFVRDEREARGWSQAELARRAEVNAKSLGHWELLERAPGINELSGIAEAFGWSLPELMARADQS